MTIAEMKTKPVENGKIYLNQTEFNGYLELLNWKAFGHKDVSSLKFEGKSVKLRI